MSKPYYKKSTITGRRYDIFNACRILNLAQVCFYIQNEVPIEDIEIGEDRKYGTPILVFLFDKDLSHDAYDLWCNKQ